MYRVLEGWISMEIFFWGGGGGHSFIDSKRKNGFVGGGIVEGNCDGTRPIFVAIGSI